MFCELGIGSACWELPCQHRRCCMERDHHAAIQRHHHHITLLLPLCTPVTEIKVSLSMAPRVVIPSSHCSLMQVVRSLVRYLKGHGRDHTFDQATWAQSCATFLPPSSHVSVPSGCHHVFPLLFDAGHALSCALSQGPWPGLRLRPSHQGAVLSNLVTSLMLPCLQAVKADCSAVLL